MQCPHPPKWLQAGSAFSFAVFVLFAALAPFAAKAMLTVRDSGFSADGQLKIDTPGSISIGTASSTGITIGSANATTTFPGNIMVGYAITTGLGLNSFGDRLTVQGNTLDGNGDMAGIDVAANNGQGQINNYGLKLEDQSRIGTNNYNVYSAGTRSQNRFEG